ncbi:type-1 angiotensin II receptor-associated protein-like [Rhopilema esculentum]|uniref:type-1 angiotensin II receptor-associated protein-like n=1 Tax=Rhopilema esculentum TaxID=499914 RepID=UPI0031D541D9
MLQSLPTVPIKYFLISHFILVTWAALYLWMGECYIYSNYLVLIVGLWALKDKSSNEPMQFLLGIHLFTILNDIILLGMYFPIFNKAGNSARFQFTAAMAIINLLLKPVSGIFIFKEYQIRGAGETSYEDLGGPAGPPSGKQEVAPPYAPSGGYMPPTSANTPYNQGSY